MLESDPYFQEIEALLKKVERGEKPIVLERSILENPYFNLLLYLAYSYVGKTYEQIKEFLKKEEIPEMKKLLEANLIDLDERSKRYKLTKKGVILCNAYIIHGVIKNEAK